MTDPQSPHDLDAAARQLITPGGNVIVSRDPAIAARQLAIERDRINLSPSLTPAAKRWRIQYTERSYEMCQYSHTLSWQMRLAWTIICFPIEIARAFFDMPNILLYGMLGGHCEGILFWGIVNWIASRGRS